MLVAAEFFLPLRAFGSAFHVAMNGVSAGKLMLTLLEEPEPAWGKLQPCGGRLELEDVYFSYEQGRETLHGVSAVFPERGMTAIVGESGCGKTTVAKLLTGALRPGSGRVLLDGKPVESLDRQAYYASLAHVSCETFLFHDSVRANFLLANPHAAEEEMWRALALVRLDGLVRERGGLDFVLNEDAADISGGQKQRLALAVNLTAPKRIYIFDEATGNIDAESEAIIMEVVRSLSTFAGVTVITHRLANVVAADSILYMEDGRICERGDHASLMARGRRYAALLCAQRELEQGYLELIKEAQMKKELSRRSGARIAAELMKLLGGRLFAVMLLAVLNGSLGFLCAMGVSFFGAVGIAKALGESIPLSYGAIAGLCVGCGVLRGGLRYLEQYGNHYIAFRLLAVLRDKIFTKLRALCPAKLESRQKGSLLTMITADIETLEVFYAHTVSPVCIAVLVSLAVMAVTGLAASWYLSLIAAAAYLCSGTDGSLGTSARIFSTASRAYGSWPSITPERPGPPRSIAAPTPCWTGRRPSSGKQPFPPPPRRPPCRYRCWQCWLWGSSSFTAAASAQGAWCWV